MITQNKTKQKHITKPSAKGKNKETGQMPTSSKKQTRKSRTTKQNKQKETNTQHTTQA